MICGESKLVEHVLAASSPRKRQRRVCFDIFAQEGVLLSGTETLEQSLWDHLLFLWLTGS